MTEAEELLDRAAADPAGTLERGGSYVAKLAKEDYRERSIALRAMSLAARFTNQNDMSISLAGDAVVAAREGGFVDLEALGVLTMTGSMAIAGQVEEALSTIRSAQPGIEDPELIARFRFQEGAVLANTGRLEESTLLFEETLPYFRSLGEARSLVLVLNRLGSNLSRLGRLSEAEEYLTEALEVALAANETASVPGIEHNLGLLTAHRGDIPAALELLLRSDERGMAVSGASAPQHVARCEVLMSAGLFEEALTLAKRVAKYNEQNQDVEHQANALLVAAQAALYAGRLTEAAELAEQAGAMLVAASSPLLALEARKLAIEAQYEESGPSLEGMREAAGIADALQSSGLLVASGQARLLGGRMAMQLGNSDVAADLLSDVAAMRVGPVELRLQARLAAALLTLDSGDKRGAAAAVRSGLDLLDRYQEALGATDLRMGIERHGVELGEIGLRLGIESRRPRRVLDWMERTRAGALRFASVTPSRDDEMRRLLANLRRIDADLRDPDQHTPELLRRRRVLQDEIARVDRTRRSKLTHLERPKSDDLIDSLGDSSLLEMGVDRGQLYVVVADRNRARLVHVGPVSAVEDELRQVRFGMRRAALRGRVFDQVALEHLDGAVFGTIAVSADRVIVVPPPGLMALPWAALPSLRGRQVSVSPSADLWWRAALRSNAGNRTVIAGGPDLEHAAHEIAAVGAVHDKAESFPPDSTVEEVRDALEGAGLAHIVCHAAFQVENPMFSSLRLGDGDLNVYDIERLTNPPGVVVLSACDSGYSETRPGEELAGLTSALLSMGTTNVVASIGLVPDTLATSDLMVEFHRQLAAGSNPSQALAEAQKQAFDDPDRFLSAASFISVGA